MDTFFEGYQFAIEVRDLNERLLIEKTGQNQVSLVYKGVFQEGDKICFRMHPSCNYLVIRVDDFLGDSFVYIPGNFVEYAIPFGEDTNAYSPDAFKGDQHVISIRVATKEEKLCIRNLALNTMDVRGTAEYYPHATSNIETRGESVFAARNVIDGHKENNDHGKWPYTSWGPDLRENAELKLDFGRIVEIERVVLYLRADFPHDSFWQHVTLLFSDNTEKVVELKKIGEPQTIIFNNIKADWLKIINLKKADESAEFPALTQIEVYGKDL